MSNAAFEALDGALWHPSCISFQIPRNSGMVRQYGLRQYPDGNVQCAFLMGKSGVMPRKYRLELTAAVLSSALAPHLMVESGIQFRRTLD